MRKVNWVTPLAIAGGLVLLWFVLDWGSAPHPAAPVSSSPAPPPAVTPSATAGEDDHDEHDGHDHAEEGIDIEATPYPSPSFDGGENADYTHEAVDVEAALDVTTQFIAGWLNPDADARRAQLEPIAAGDLVDQLSDPYLRIWQTTVQGEPTLTQQTGTAVTTEQAFVDGRRVTLYLLYDPTIETRWTVVDIQPVKES